MSNVPSAASGGDNLAVPPSGQDATLIEAEENVDVSDDDSALGDDVQSATTSLKSVVTKYVEENGRRYQSAEKEGANYFLPNDDKELDRLDMFHHCLTVLLNGKLFLAPIGSSPERILDLGTGTGIWAIDMGDKFPSAHILGNDISPVQPNLVPPNVHFEIDDVEKEWIYTNKFDFIHCRYLTGSVKNWQRLVQQAFNFVKPGGWVEFQEFEWSFYSHSKEFKEDCAGNRWVKTISSALEGWGIDSAPGPKLEQWVKDAGFQNVNHTLFPIPLGPWAKDKRLKEVGAFDLMVFLEGLEPNSLRPLTAAYNWTPEEIKVFLAHVRKDLLNIKLQIQHNFHVVYAQKPLED